MKRSKRMDLFSIRMAGPKDIPALAKLFDAYRRFYRQRSDVGAAERFLRKRLSKKESVVFLAYSGKQSWGFLQLYPSFSSIALKRSWVLNDLYVIPQARKKGVAAALMAHAKRLAAKTLAEGLCLETAVDNKPAQRLYEKLGWKREKDFYSYNYDL